jgi:malonyl-CoA/methylmalonyl-CoA synthetase
MTSITLPRTPIFEALSQQPQNKTAIVHSASGKKFSYGSLLSDVAATRTKLLGSEDDLRGKRVAMLVENGYEYAGVLPRLEAGGGGADVED